MIYRNIKTGAEIITNSVISAPGFELVQPKAVAPKEASKPEPPKVEPPKEEPKEKEPPKAVKSAPKKKKGSKK